LNHEDLEERTIESFEVIEVFAVLMVLDSFDE